MGAGHPLARLGVSVARVRAARGAGRRRSRSTPWAVGPREPSGSVGAVRWLNCPKWIQTGDRRPTLGPWGAPVHLWTVETENAAAHRATEIGPILLVN